MEIKLHNIAIRDLVEGYQDNQEAGVVGFGDRLNIRPPYQREFVYNDKQREAVIDTITRDFPLNTMYWAITPEGFEIIDGQQRTISICQYVDGVFSYKDRYFHNLQHNERDSILNYKLTVYQCQGADSEKLDWFRIINIAGEKLTDQELRNAVYAGSWTADAKRYFSKNQCAAWIVSEKYMNGAPNRQDYLETAISWINNGDIDGYMAKHQHDKNANPLWLYFQTVINWVKATFTKYRREMKGIAWGILYNKYKDDDLDPRTLEESVARLMADDDVTRKKGIYEFLLTRNEKYLSIREFTDGNKRTLYERQNGACAACLKIFEIGQMEADHVTPWSQGGKTELVNGQMLCRECNRRKSDR
ncbi:HNH endonuclease [Acidithiobacillus thiooxidans ATCC 19377]|uniref:HNH endonuclease n=2 Tax=Acidithiobacillus thiooxidans TaxID=930 RepID=A0A5P9XMT5_ACITH|nr:HNH endonuclease [Acidithiobacillus thiooxidans ATCC 19377]